VRLSLRFFLAYFLLLGVAVGFVMQSFSEELVPGMRQSLEEVLIDTANLLAEVVSRELEQQRIGDGEFAAAMEAFGKRHLNAVIWFLKKRDPNMMVYITDADGIVRYDSRGRDVGKDYSRWNDVYLTLQGEYGARSTRDDPQDEFSSVMYVAAPVRSNGRVIGVLAVGKPSVTVQPFVEAALDNIRSKGIWIVFAALLLGLLLTHWLTLSIRKLTAYARAVQEGRRVTVPQLRERELAQLAVAMESMRTELEGKHYVEHYLHTLTHELKSPLAAIAGAAELLGEEMPRERQQRFVANIRGESERLRQVVEQLLRLAALEKRRDLEHVETVELHGLIEQLVEDKSAILLPRKLSITVQGEPALEVEGERFLLQQALGNLLDNAIAFSPEGGEIGVTLTRVEDAVAVTIRDHGPGIPDYARERLFERFYSLPQPASGQKGSGLGLSLVQEVVQLHGGSIHLDNHAAGGTEARISLPLSQPQSHRQG